MSELIEPTAVQALVCRVQAELPTASLLAASVHGSDTIYRLDPRAGPIVFGVDQCGLFNAHGSLSRYGGTLALDRANPTALRVDLMFDTASIALTRCGRNALPFAPRFDIAAHPMVRFRSTALTPSGPRRCQARGLLEIAGVTRLETIEAELVDHAVDPITGTDVAEVLIEHRLAVSAFGLLPGQTFLCDRIDLSLRAWIELDI